MISNQAPRPLTRTSVNTDRLALQEHATAELMLTGNLRNLGNRLISLRPATAPLNTGIYLKPHPMPPVLMSDRKVVHKNK
jgi:hypothetical protein